MSDQPARKKLDIRPSGLLTVQEAAAYLRLSESYLGRRKNSRPKETRMGGKLFFHIDDIDQWIRECRAA